MSPGANCPGPRAPNHLSACSSWCPACLSITYERLGAPLGWVLRRGRLRETCCGPGRVVLSSILIQSGACAGMCPHVMQTSWVACVQGARPCPRHSHLTTCTGHVQPLKPLSLCPGPVTTSYCIASIRYSAERALPPCADSPPRPEDPAYVAFVLRFPWLTCVLH